MAASSDARHKSRLIREMARDLNRHDHSVASSTGSHHGTVSDSTVSDFDPENEAIMSTRQMEMNSQRLPELRDTAKKYGRWNGGRQSDFIINTSAIGRAFPDFSQGGSSDDSMSIEVGRGAKTRQRTPSQMPQLEYSNDIDSPIVTIGDFRVLGTPPMKQPTKATQQQSTHKGSIRKPSQTQRTSSAPYKENVPPSDTANLASLPDYVSGATRTATGEQRRTLAEIHARVADESDGSFIGDERPPTITFAAKNSRFNNFQPRNSPLSNISNQKTRQATDAMVDALAGRRKASQLQTPQRPSTGTMNSNTQNPTNQSFLLPNMPEISELVSGTFRDGTPVFTKNGKIQSRFTPNGTDRGSSGHHNPVDSIPVPDDEKAIFLSLQLLQDKVRDLEMERANNQRTVEELQQANFQLQAEKRELQKRRRSDSALGMADSASDGEYARDNQKLVTEKIKLEGQVKSLQSRLEGTERKVSNQELRLNSNTAERDQAVKQLAEAFNLIEQLKSENQTITDENLSLRQQVTQLLSQIQENTRRWQETETTLQKKIQRRDQAVSQLREMTQDITGLKNEIYSSANFGTSRAAKINSSSRKHKSEQSQSLLSKQDNGQSSSRGRLSLGQPSSAPRVQSRQRLRSRSRSQSGWTSKQTATVDDFDDGVSVSDTTEGESLVDATKTIHKDINVTADEIADDSDGSNYSSILGDDLVRMRQILATQRQELAKKHAVVENNFDAQLKDDTHHSARSMHLKNMVQQKSGQPLMSILKNPNGQDDDDVTGRLSVKSNGKGKQTERTQTSRSETTHHRRHSENSVQTSARRRVTHEEMTSAFILPDITFSNVAHGIERPFLSESARRKLDQLCQHDARNCTICSRVTSFETKDGKTTKIEVKKTVQIEKPVPVSERMPEVGPFEDEPTMRPAVAPGLALATVIKGLEDEISHLRLELSPLQMMYNQHDPSLGMRKRKATSARISQLQKDIDRKSDQLYALYDVLEGQKQSGQEMSEKEIEITLQSIGVDIENLTEKKAEAENGDGDSDEDSDMDLPWEGIDDTSGSKRHSFRL